MPRAKNRVASRRRRKKLLKTTSGNFGKRANCFVPAKATFWRSGVYNYRDRKARKQDFRALWIMRINAGARLNGISYSQFIKAIKEKGVELNRKTLAYLAMYEPATFTKIVETVKA